MDWEILVPLPITVHTAVTRLVGQNELIIMDVRSSRKQNIAKSNVFEKEEFKNITIEGIGSAHNLPILYIDAEANNYRM